MSISPQTPLGQLVVEKPGRTVVLESFGLDYCCGGAKTLAVQCKAKSIDANVVIQKIEEHDNRDARESIDWKSRPLSALVNHILKTHHEYLRQVMPQLATMTAKVADVHGERKPEFVELRKVFNGLHAELENHMSKEESILFPAVIQWEQAGTPEGGGKQLAAPIRVMLMEHDAAGQALEKLRNLADDYTPDAEACNTVRGMMSALSALETDLHMHIHLENNILFPRVLESDSLGAAVLS
jgi:regulator of cell morphogenesis and NO signaling